MVKLFRVALFTFAIAIVTSPSLAPATDSLNSSLQYQTGTNATLALQFTPDEQHYLLDKKQINMCIDPNWMPLESIQNGVHVGMTADYFQIMQKALPIPIVLVPAKTWGESIEFAKARKCDIYSLAMATPERETYMDFTKPYLSIPLVMAASIDRPFVDDITSLQDATLGVVKGYAFGELLRARFPHMDFYDVGSVKEGLQRVVEGDLDGFVGTLSTVGYTIQKNFPGELKVAGKFDERWELGVGTRNDEPLLHSIFDKIICGLDQKTHQKILNHWISVKFEQRTDYTIYIQVLLVFGVGIILLLIKNYALRKYSKKLQAQNSQILAQKAKLQETEKQLLLTQYAIDSCVFPILWAAHGASLEDTRIIHANQAAVSLLGYELEQLKGLSLLHLDVENSEENWASSLRNVQNKTGLAIGTSYKCRDGNKIPVDLFISDFNYLDQCYLFLFLVDKTRQLEIETQLHRSMKMESIGLMAGGVAHDLNNILSGLIGYPDLLLINVPDGDPIQAPLEAIKESGLRAAEIVADLLTVARGVAAEKIVASLNNIIHEYLKSPEYISLQGLYPTISYTQNLDKTLLNNYCSVVHIKKCIMNLVSNAAESLESDGLITISSANIYIEKSLSEEMNIAVGEYVTLAVTDNGPGISHKDLDHIFEPFYTKKQMGRSGTGLGLAVVWNTIEDHNGTVQVSSSAQGTTFTLFFPATRKECHDAKIEIPISTLKGNCERILVVDDEKQQRDLATKMLSLLNYEVMTVSSGEEAVAYLRENEVELVVLDMIMTPGINGRETYEQILECNPRQRAIIASGFSINEEVERTLDLGAGRYIRKPYLINQIGVGVQEVLKGSKEQN